MKKLVKIILILASFIGIVLGGGVLMRSKGEWVCEEGEWVKMGKPKGEPPIGGCEKRVTPTRQEPRPTRTPASGSFGLPFEESSFLEPAGYEEGTGSGGER